MESLSFKYSVPLLVFLLNKSRVMKTELMEVVSNIQSLDKLLLALNQDGLISIEVETINRKVYWVSLTKKGHQAASLLVQIENLS